jgi:threonine dehydrogenase-like Zn-dependent dehydrogenase
VLLIPDARLGINLAVVPDEVPLEVAALTEPMAVARHAVNRTGVGPGDSVVVFGAGPTGLGAIIGYKLSGARSVVVVDVIPSRLDKALAVAASPLQGQPRQPFRYRARRGWNGPRSRSPRGRPIRAGC